MSMYLWIPSRYRFVVHSYSISIKVRFSWYNLFDGLNAKSKWQQLGSAALPLIRTYRDAWLSHNDATFKWNSKRYDGVVLLQLSWSYQQIRLSSINYGHQSLILHAVSSTSLIVMKECRVKFPFYWNHLIHVIEMAACRLHSKTEALGCILQRNSRIWHLRSELLLSYPLMHQCNNLGFFT